MPLCASSISARLSADRSATPGIGMNARIFNRPSKRLPTGKRMNFLRLEQMRPMCCSVALLLTITGCGGGGSDTTDVSTTVVDGAIQNAVVCLDKNRNGTCDPDEAQGKTDAAGKVTLAVPNDDLGKYPIVAAVGTDAVDADHGPVTVPYTLSAPADQTGVVSPLTTLVQQTVASTGVSTADAAKAVQDGTGLTVSLFQDFTKATPPADGGPSAATLARMLVVTTQQQALAVSGVAGTAALDGSVITREDIDRAVQKKLLELLPDLVSRLSDPSVLAATTPAAKEAAILAAASTLVTGSGLQPAALPTVVAINNQTASATQATIAPAPSVTLQGRSFTNAMNYAFRVFTASTAQNTPDANNNVKYVERRVRSAGGSLAKWGAGSEPQRGADLHWNGKAWVNCPINFENTSSVRDAQGNNVYNYCDNAETGKSARASFDVSGKTMSEVYAQARTAGYTNLFLADPKVLGSATFPTGSVLSYQASTSLTAAISYYPAGSDSPADTSNVVSQYSPAVSAGGDAALQAAGVGCNSAEHNNSSGTRSTSLEGMIAAMTGTPCVHVQGSFVYSGVTYTNTEDALNESWGNSTVSIGKIGTALAGSGPAPGYYTTNTRLRAAFKGAGANAVTYYACRERFVGPSTRNCKVIGTGSYTITTLGDARVMTLNNLPVQAAALDYRRVFVERGGYVYFGFQNKPTVYNTARLNIVGANAFLQQLGVATEDPAIPLALTAASYQGSWDLLPTGSAEATRTVFIGTAGTPGVTVCQNRTTLALYACTLTVTDPATGAFTFSDAIGNTASGIASFINGTAAGTYHDPAATPSDVSFTAHRR
jgi:hypothetical protein